MGPHQDVVGELAKAIKAEGLKFVTTFHHQWNWAWYPTWNGLVDTSTARLRDFYGATTSPETFDSVGQVPKKYGTSSKFVKKWKAKIFEVIDNYRPDMIWFDSRLNIIPAKERQEMLAHYYNKAKVWNKPVVLTYKHHDVPVGAGVLDIERGRLAKKVNYPWLTDDSWDWTTWDYKPDPINWKNANEIVDELIDIVSKNGCLLLDIGPKANGLIPKKVKTGLLKIGSWLHKYGEAIYGTRPFVTSGEGPTRLKENRLGGVNDRGITYTPKDFRFTTKGDNLYIIQLGTPNPQEQFILKSFARDSVAGDVRIKSLKLVSSHQAVQWSKQKDGLHITTPPKLPNNTALVYKAVIKLY
jgi:alpha-L-fucosidase